MSIEWMGAAVCRSVESELFFPTGTAGPALLQTEQAKAVCRRCDVRTECGEYALERRYADGVWGGMSEEERRSILRRRDRERVAGLVAS